MFHVLRHTHVTWLIDAGWKEFRMVRRLGWKDGRMLYTVYGHLFRNHDEELMEAWRLTGAAMFPARDGGERPRGEACLQRRVPEGPDPRSARLHRSQAAS